MFISSTDYSSLRWVDSRQVRLEVGIYEHRKTAGDFRTAFYRKSETGYDVMLRKPMKSFCSLLLIPLLATTIAAQSVISRLDIDHRSALEKFLATRQELGFRSELVLSEDYRKSVAEWFGKEFMPNYARGDFNKDKRQDFGVLLTRQGKASWMNGEG